MGDRKKVLIYAGSDFTSLQALNELVPYFVKQGVEPIMVFPDVPTFENPNAYSEEMQEFAFFDRDLFQNVMRDCLNDPKYKIITASNGDPKEGICYTPEQLEIFYGYQGARSVTLKDVNSPEHVAYVKNDKNIIAGVSIRCLQIFHQDIIDAHRGPKNLPGPGRGFLLNVHPGMLPQFRGLLPVFQAASAGEEVTTYTVHGIEQHSKDENVIDRGTVYEEQRVSYHQKQGVLMHMHNNVDAIVAPLRTVMDGIIQNGLPPGVRETLYEDTGKYFSFPSPEEIFDFKHNKKGVFIGDYDKVIKAMVKSCTNGSSEPLRLALTDLMHTAVQEEFGTSEQRRQKRIDLSRKIAGLGPANSNESPEQTTSDFSLKHVGYR